jgi:hypothetical protein
MRSINNFLEKHCTSQTCIGYSQGQFNDVGFNKVNKNPVNKEISLLV